MIAGYDFCVGPTCKTTLSESLVALSVGIVAAALLLLWLTSVLFQRHQQAPESSPEQGAESGYEILY